MERQIPARKRVKIDRWHAPALPEPSGAGRRGHADRSRGLLYEFAVLAGESGIRLSVGRTGQCWDNALAESFFATSKNELIGTQPWPSRSAARTAIFEWIESWYNLHRLHSSLGYRSPATYEATSAA